jgi:hypothetical protein
MQSVTDMDAVMQKTLENRQNEILRETVIVMSNKACRDH